MTPNKGQWIEIEDEDSILIVRRETRALARDMGFGTLDQTRITTVASELARNVFRYAGTGTAAISAVQRDSGENGIELIFCDSGPGIGDLSAALTEGYTTGGGLGIGLSGAKKLMDDFEIDSTPGSGTMIRVRKWL